LRPLADRSVLLAGVGNIGSYLAPLLVQSSIGRLTLIDRDVVEPKNLTAQNYRPEDVGRPKAVVQAERLQARFPDCVITGRVGHLEDLPLGVARCDLLLGALDSRRARQVLISEIAWPLGVQVIDGGVGDAGQGRVQVFHPGANTACLECTWGQADYRLLAAEYPCLPGAHAEAAPTRAPAHLGSFTASLMAAEAVRLLTRSEPETPESYEVVFDLNNLQMRRFGLRRASRCRHDHAVVTERVPLPAEATFADVLCLPDVNLTSEQVSVECRRGLGMGSMGGARWLSRSGLLERGAARLLDSGFVAGDYLRMRAGDRQLFLELPGEGKGN
jgi:molybdopterin/thiamine biosynthesis adenylyltransferase